MINQLFYEHPDFKLIITCLEILGFKKGLKDKSELYKQDLEKINIPQKFNELKSEFKNIYISCKYNNIFSNELKLKKCITITKQLLKTINYDINSYEKTIDKKKTIAYSLTSIYNKEIKNKSTIDKMINKNKKKNSSVKHNVLLLGPTKISFN